MAERPLLGSPRVRGALAVVVCAIIFMAIIFTGTRDAPYNGTLTGLSVNYDSHGSRALNLTSDFGLDNDSLSYFMKRSISLRISCPEANASFTYVYEIEKDKAVVPDELIDVGLFIARPIAGKGYNVTMHYAVNGTSMLTLLGTNNWLNLTVWVDASNHAHAKPAAGYEAYSDLITEDEGNAYVWIVKGDAENPEPELQKGHRFAVWAQVVA